jgi:rod shape-determining protein MreD
MFIKYLKYALITILLILVQKTFIPLINIYSIVPDLVFIYIVLVSVSEGQISGMVMGFCTGLALDFVASSFLGLCSLTYSVGGFIAGYFFDDFKSQYIIHSYNFIFIIFLSSIISNVVYFSFFIQGNEQNFWFLLAKYAIGSSLYSVIVSLIFVFIISKRKLKVTKEVPIS